MTKPGKIKIAIGQMKIEQKNILEKGIGFIKEARKNESDIICFPELFFQETNNEIMFQALSKAAKENEIYIVGGYAELIKDKEKKYNAIFFINDKGETIGNMRKVNLKKDERATFDGGEKFPVYDTPLGKIGIMISYDMEFPESMRIMALKGAEIVIVPSIWSRGEERRWDISLAAGALYNVFFTIGTNGTGNKLCGLSKVVGPDGEVLAQASKEEGILYCDIDRKQIKNIRAKIPYINDFKESTFCMDAINKY